MISTKTIIDKANQSIAGTPTEEQVTYLTQIEDALKKTKLTVATTGDLPDVADNKGRLVYVTAEEDYYFSDGSEWLSDFSSVLQSLGSTIYTTGNGFAGRLGDDATVNRSSPVTVVGGITNWSVIESGRAHSLGLTDTGVLYAWGYNSFGGGLGDGQRIDRSSPVTVIGGITNWSAISAGGYFSIGLTDTGVLYAWGNGGSGQVGDGTNTSRSSPVTVAGGITNWSVVSSGGSHSLGITDTGVLYSWGSGGFGQLGNGADFNEGSPVSVVGGITNWSAVSGGGIHSLGIANGIAYAWGNAFQGRLGNESTTNKSSPVTVVGNITNWSAVAAGDNHSLGLTDTGILYAWGDAGFGQLGNGERTDRSSPVTVAGGITNWSAVAAGDDHSLGLTDTGILYAWGDNNSLNGRGQLGDDSTVNKSSPVTVVGGITSWSAISAGRGHSIAISSLTKGFNEP